MSVDASALNRIPAALGHAPSVLAFFTPQSGGSPNANHIHSLYEITLYIGLAVFVAGTTSRGPKSTEDVITLAYRA